MSTVRPIPLRNVTLGLLLVLGSAGCSSGSSTPPVAAAPTTSGGSTTGAPSSSATGSLTPADNKGLAWAKCMRTHGVNVADPSTSGKGAQLLFSQKGAPKAKTDAAMAACKKLLPDGGSLIKPDPSVIAQERKMSTCMRANGIPKFPDPSADGSLTLSGGDGLDPGSATFKKAQAACSKYAPDGPKGAGQVLGPGK